MRKNVIILALLSIVIIATYQNCSEIDLNHINSLSKTCNPVTYGIRTDNTDPDNVRFSIIDLDTLITVSQRNFSWKFSENRINLQSAEAPELVVHKADLVACHTYEVTATYIDCDEEINLEVNYTADGENCDPPPIPTPTPEPIYPPPNPAPPGQQSVGSGCIGGGIATNPNFNYAQAKYCHADYDFRASPQVAAQYNQCRQSGVDVSQPGQGIYYLSIRPDEYVAMEIEVPHVNYDSSKTLCGFFFMGEGPASACGGIPAAVDTWALSTNPGDFSGSCISHTSAGGMWGRVRSNPDIEPNNNCLMDRGRKYYINIKMDPTCRNPGGCAFLLMTQPIYSGATQTINGQRYVVNNQCNLVLQP